jgi:hypothetical protein
MKPEYVYPIDEQKYVYAICRCNVTTDYAIKMPKIEGKYSYKFHCDDCGLTGEVITGRLIGIEDLR